MYLFLKVDGFVGNVKYTEECFDGIRLVFRFENNYGASVVKNSYSYGHEKDLWELAVIKFRSDCVCNYCWELNYDTPITNDVIGYLTNDEVLEILKQIKEL